MAFFKHRYEVCEILNESDGWSSAIIRYMGYDEKRANEVYKKLKATTKNKVEIKDDVYFDAKEAVWK